MSDLNIAIIQSSIHWEDTTANLAMFEEKIWELEEEVDLILLPEMFTTGFSMEPARLAEVPGMATHKWMLQMANQKNALVGGSYIVKEGTTYYNRFFAAFPDGSYQTYDKRHLFSLAKEEIFFTAGNEKVILDFKGWKICPLICYDLRFPVWAKNKRDKDSGVFDYDLLLYVANWPKPRISAWDTLLKARAIENQTYTLGANRVALDGNGFEYVGHSGIYDYLGSELIKLENEEGILLQKLNKSAQDKFREKFSFVGDGDQFSIG